MSIKLSIYVICDSDRAGSYKNIMK